MLIAYAGRLPDSEDFPQDNVDHVGEQVSRLLGNLRAEAVIGSAAAGADLLVLAAAVEIGASATVLLAGTRAQFRESSVAGRGAKWERLFDALCSHKRVTLIELPRGADDASSFRAVTEKIEQLADREAERRPVVGLNVANVRDGSDRSADLATAQELRGRLVLRVDTARTREQTPSAFVAMPYGNRPDGYRADATYRRIILPALIDSGYRPIRADTEMLLEMIDISMLHSISTARVLIADLATLNANVMWELGVRHAWRRAGTILLRPAGTPSPFDISHARVHKYSRSRRTVSDGDAIAGIHLLRELLEAVEENRTDSPVFAAFPGMSEPVLPTVHPVGAAIAAAHEYAERISLAADMHDTGALAAHVERIRADRRLEESARGPLLEQIGLALISIGDHARAAEVLGPLADADSAMEQVRLQQQYAHALIRSSDSAGRAERLQRAEHRLRALIGRHPPSSESYGLLGSAAKARVEHALATGQPLGAELSVAIDAYRRGFRLDPGDSYPGVVALALLRLRGQHLSPNEQDVRDARELVPVVRFAAERLGGLNDRDTWRLATLAELALHDHLLNAEPQALTLATSLYTRVAAAATPDQCASVIRQLRMLRDAGDPPGAIDSILAIIDPTQRTAAVKS